MNNILETSILARPYEQRYDMLRDIESEETRSPKDGVYEDWGKEKLGMVEEGERCKADQLREKVMVRLVRGQDEPL